MLTSLAQHCPAHRCYVLCLDDFTHAWLQRQGNAQVVPIALRELEDADPELVACQSNRSRLEYFFTLSPCLPLYLLERYQMPFICSLDADMFFYQDPTPLFEQFADYSVLISEHYHSDPECQFDLKTGYFNVSFQAFRYNQTGMACLRRWREQCLEWCYHYCDERLGRYADQKYLDTWPTDYPGEVLTLRPRVAALATWNLNHYDLTYQQKALYSDGEPLIFYHFHGLRFLDSWWIANQFSWHQTRCTSVVRDHLYLPYLQQLWRIEHRLRKEGLTLPTATRRAGLLAAIKARTVFFWPTMGTLMYIDFAWMHWLRRVSERIFHSPSPAHLPFARLLRIR